MSIVIDRVSLLVSAPGSASLSEVERALGPALTLGFATSEEPVSEWLARGAPGAPSSFADPADHLVAGLTGVLASGKRIEVHPAPRRAVGPDLVALFVGAGGRFGTIEHVWLRVHAKDARRVSLPFTAAEAPISAEEEELLAAIAREL